MKQTAVEWLEDNLHYLHSTKWDDILEQAKEMEKQQIIDAYESLEHRHGQNYYNATFKQVCKGLLHLLLQSHIIFLPCAPFRQKTLIASEISLSLAYEAVL